MIGYDRDGENSPRSRSLIKYIGIPFVFAFILAVLFYKNLQRILDAGGDLSDIMDGTFTLLLSLIFAIIGVYLVIHVLHPSFGKRPVPAKLEKIVDEKATEDMTRDELLEFVNDLGSDDEEISGYIDTITVKADIAVTLGLALAAFFCGMYGYMESSVAAYHTPDILIMSLSFMFVIFSIIYTMLKTMKVVWDV